MKKALALISAAAVIFAAAGCANKKQPEQNETQLNSDGSSAVQESTVEESVAEPSASIGEHTTKEKYTRRPTVTLYTTRATSPNHLTERPSTTERTTIKINVPTRETTSRRQVTTRTTVPRTTKTTVESKTSTTKPVPEPVFDYGGTLSFTGADGLTDSVKIVSHTCEPTDRQTFAIVLTVETLEHASQSKTMYISYNCYDKDGNRINENTLQTIVPLGQPGETVRTVATATFDTARIEFVQK
ncbi:MAG: hypothetical protein IJN81_10365 [Clostridia bacterium]|nr:hypothetical protein [Clostridia bacterium]